MERLVATAAIAFLHSPLLVWLQEIWGGFGLAGAAASIATLPVIAGLLFLRRDGVRTLNRLAPRFSKVGAAVMVGGGMLAAAAAVYQVLPVLGLSLPLCIAGYLIWTRGLRAVAPVLVPVGLLIFLTPLTEATAPGLGHALQIGSAQGATWLLELAGLPATLDGVVITTGVTTNTVTQECSGLATLTALLFYGLVTGYILRLNLARTGLVVGLLLPLSLAVNSARIAFISWLLFAYGEPVAEGPLHNGSGYALFALAYGVSFYVALRLARTQTSQRPAKAITDQSPTAA